MMMEQIQVMELFAYSSQLWYVLVTLNHHELLKKVMNLVIKVGFYFCQNSS